MLKSLLNINMSLQKSEDFKVTAVKYYLESNVLYVDVCKIFKCGERSLKRWIEKYQKSGQIKRNNKKPISYKITKKRVEYAIQKPKDNQQIIMEESAKIQNF